MHLEIKTRFALLALTLAAPHVAAQPACTAAPNSCPTGQVCATVKTGCPGAETYSTCARLQCIAASGASPAPVGGGASLNRCAADAVDARGQPLEGIARDAYIRQCEAQKRYPPAPDPTPAACAAKARQLPAAQRDALVKKCIVDTRAVQ